MRPSMRRPAFEEVLDFGAPTQKDPWVPRGSRGICIWKNFLKEGENRLKYSVPSPPFVPLSSLLA